MFAISKKGLYGFINIAGEVVIAPKFDRVGIFSEGLAWASLRTDDNCCAGFIDESGEFVIPPIFSGYGLDSFHELFFADGIAPVALGAKTMIYINRSGERVSDLVFEKAYSLHEGRGLVSINGLFGYVDNRAQIVIPCQFDEPDIWIKRHYFSEGRALVKFLEPDEDGDEDSCFGYINLAGESVFECRFTAARPFKSGYAMVRMPEDLIDYSVITADGDFVFDKITQVAANFSEGLLLFYDNDSELYGYLDTNGDWAIQPKYKEAYSFSDGLAAVKARGDRKFGFINKEGQIIIENQFKEVLPFENGLAYVESGKHAGFINLKGEWVWKTTDW